ncbi:hypothetical protein KCU89_g3, partial [Aureobasidium melanogenum]
LSDCMLQPFRFSSVGEGVPSVTTLCLRFRLVTVRTRYRSYDPIEVVEPGIVLEPCETLRSVRSGSFAVPELRFAANVPFFMSVALLILPSPDAAMYKRLENTSLPVASGPARRTTGSVAQTLANQSRLVAELVHTLSVAKERLTIGTSVPNRNLQSISKTDPPRFRNSQKQVCNIDQNVGTSLRLHDEMRTIRWGGRRRLAVVTRDVPLPKES